MRSVAVIRAEVAYRNALAARNGAQGVQNYIDLDKPFQEARRALAKAKAEAK